MKTLITLLLVAAPLMAQMSVNWEHDFASAQKRAKTEKKQIFLDLWTEWCPPCRYLRDEIFPKPASQAALAQYIPFSSLVQKKDRTPVEEGTKLAGKYNLQAFPTLIILDAEGKEIRRHVGAFENPEGLAAWLEGK